jgi:hypothetical protein
MTAFYKLVGLELTDETASIGVISSEQGFPQRVVGPKVYQKDGVLGVKIGSELYSFKTEITEDGEARLTLNGKAATLLAEGKNPIFKLAVGSGNFIKLPVYINYNEDTQSYYEFKDLEVALTDSSAIAKIVGEPRVKGESTGGVTFSDLKSMPTGRYQIVSAKNASGKYGPTLDILLKTSEEITIPTYTKGENGWGLAESVVPAGSVVKVGGNTALKTSLMGTELKEADNVYLDVTGSRLNKEGKTIVLCDLDYSDSSLKFEF